MRILNMPEGDVPPDLNELFDFLIAGELRDIVSSEAPLFEDVVVKVALDVDDF